MPHQSLAETTISIHKARDSEVPQVCAELFVEGRRVLGGGRESGGVKVGNAFARE